MSKIGDSPAFPCNETDWDRHWDGITFRQLAAMKIMAGFASDPGFDGSRNPETAVEWADALIAALERQGRTEAQTEPMPVIAPPPGPPRNDADALLFFGQSLKSISLPGMTSPLAEDFAKCVKAELDRLAENCERFAGQQQEGGAA